MPETMRTIADRRTTRDFSPLLPDRESIDDILRAAALAPYAGATGVPLRDIRRIYVFSPDTSERVKAVEVLYETIRKSARVMRWMLRAFPFLKRKMGVFSDRLDAISQKGIPGFERGTYYIVAAEKKGFPPVAKQSLAHAMQNMWLAATDSGLGFQLVSATGIMSKNHVFMELLGLPPGQHDLDGCLIGYPEYGRDRPDATRHSAEGNAATMALSDEGLRDIVTWYDNSRTD